VASNRKSAAPKKKGRFRVTINGFHVVEAYGGDSNKDGKGNEVYIGVKLRGYNRIGGLMFNGYKATKTIGDNKSYRNRLRGGSASNTGGFRRRDEYPVPFDQTSSTPDLSERLPLLVWEGELEEGGKFITIEPVIWENQGNRSLFNIWARKKPILKLEEIQRSGSGEVLDNDIIYAASSRKINTLDIPVHSSPPAKKNSFIRSRVRALAISFEYASWLAEGCSSRLFDSYPFENTYNLGITIHNCHGPHLLRKPDRGFTTDHMEFESTTNLPGKVYVSFVPNPFHEASGGLVAYRRGRGPFPASSKGGLYVLALEVTKL